MGGASCMGEYRPLLFPSSAGVLLSSYPANCRRYSSSILDKIFSMALRPFTVWLQQTFIASAPDNSCSSPYSQIKSFSPSAKSSLKFLDYPTCCFSGKKSQPQPPSVQWTPGHPSRCSQVSFPWVSLPCLAWLTEQVPVSPPPPLYVWLYWRTYHTPT